MLYRAYYRQSGAQLLQDALALVFGHDYDGADPANRLALHNNFARFKASVGAALARGMRSYDDFARLSARPAPLRSAYLAGCLAQHVKPKPRVLDALQDRADRAITTLALSRIHLQDRGLGALLGILPRLSHLRELEMSGNLLGDPAVQMLVPALRFHPTLEAIDLSHNPFTDASLEDLLGLVRTIPNLRRLHLDVCQLSREGRQMVEAELTRPRSHCPSEGTLSCPSDELKGLQTFSQDPI
ncbi:unnamed protein product [Phytomonas sp. Hart1]|nr:unnamed protein product [Phytomonas sp. Hart1]|eukprot:CCW66798.1 unnamed protein product [Phytomonas sp. isolate Hart1]